MAPTLAGTNEFTKAQDKIVDTLANLASFQQWVNEDVDGAKDRIYVEDYDAATVPSDREPFVVLSSSEESPPIELAAYSRGATQRHKFNCNLYFDLEFHVPTPSDWHQGKEQAIRRDLQNPIGDIMLGTDAADGFISVAGDDGKFGTTRCVAEAHAFTREEIVKGYIYWLWHVIRVSDEE